MSGADRWSRLFRCLADRHRRRVVTALYVAGPDASVTIPEGVVTEDESASTVEQAYVHVHLPKLADAGFVSWAPSEHEVRRGPRFEDVQELLNAVRPPGAEFPDEWV